MKKFTIFNLKNPEKEIFLNHYLIIKQDKIVENTNNLLEDINELKILFKKTDMNNFSVISDDLYYLFSDSYELIINLLLEKMDHC